MANPDAVGQNLQDSFGNYRVAWAVPVSVGTVANAAATMPILVGGLQGTGQVIAFVVLQYLMLLIRLAVLFSHVLVLQSLSAPTVLVRATSQPMRLCRTSPAILAYQDLTLVPSLAANAVHKQRFVC
jgi:hypothetical protein